MTKFEKADSDRVDSEELGPYVDKLLEVLGHPEAMVTDESLIWDFVFSEPERVEEISESLGFEVKDGDYLADVAEKMKRAAGEFTGGGW